MGSPIIGLFVLEITLVLSSAPEESIAFSISLISVFSLSLYFIRHNRLYFGSTPVSPGENGSPFVLQPYYGRKKIRSTASQADLLKLSAILASGAGEKPKNADFSRKPSLINVSKNRNNPSAASVQHRDYSVNFLTLEPITEGGSSFLFTMKIYKKKIQKQKKFVGYSKILRIFAFLTCSR